MKDNGEAFGGSFNVLTLDLESGNGCGSTLYDCLVHIQKIVLKERETT
ncbi:hypothetical protein GGQ77_002007 [Geobacillus thermodenitrificans]|nr:hypothetical protein [Geobacillus thermodenitrificans]